VASLAPNRYRSGRLNKSPATVSRKPEIRRRQKELPMMSSASCSRPFPRAMEHSGAPPMPNRLAKAMTMEMMGRHSPSPVRDRVAFSGRRPIYIRSMIL